jgi:hypothetical protein
VKTALKEKRIQDAGDIMRNVTVELKAVLLEAFPECFHKLFKLFNTCIEAGRTHSG